MNARTAVFVLVALTVAVIALSTGTTVYYIDRKNTARKSGRRLRVLTAAVPTV